MKARAIHRGSTTWQVLAELERREGEWVGLPRLYALLHPRSRVCVHRAVLRMRDNGLVEHRVVQEPWMDDSGDTQTWRQQLRIPSVEWLDAAMDRYRTGAGKVPA